MNDKELTEEGNILRLNTARAIDTFVKEHTEAGWTAPELADVVIPLVEKAVREQMAKEIDVILGEGYVRPVEVALILGNYFAALKGER